MSSQEPAASRNDGVQELSGSAAQTIEQEAVSPADIVTERGFALAVQQTLRNFHRPDNLHNNPLLGSHLVGAALERSPATPPTQALRDLIRTHCERLGQSGKTSRFRQVLQHTYLAPLRRQQAVADAMHLSWSTYRRCLNNATRMLTTSLWEAESTLRATPSASNGGVSTRALHWLAITAVFVLVVTAGAVYLRVYWHQWKQSTENLPLATLEVLPFLNLNHDANKGYLSDGITDELIMRLRRIPALRVVVPTALPSAGARFINKRDSGWGPAVNHVVEGSVQSSAGTLRIQVALVNTVTGYESWSKEFIADHGKILQTEDAIAGDVVAQLSLAPDPSSSTRSGADSAGYPEARDFYWVGMEYLNERTVPAIKQAIHYFHKSIQADGNYANSWAALAMAYAILRNYAYDEPPDTHYGDAMSAVNKAIALDPSLAMAHAVLGLLHEEHWEWPQARQEFQRALKLDPGSATAHEWYARYFWFTGNAQQAVRQMRLAHDLDPLSPVISAELGRALSYAGAPMQAKTQFRTSIALAPRFGLTYALMAENDLAMRRYQQALGDARTAGNIWRNPAESYLLMEESVANAGLGQKDLARHELAQLQQRASRHYLSGVVLSRVFWGLGDGDQAFAQLQRATQTHDHLLMIVFGPDWSRMRADPRFAGIRKLMNLPPAPAVH